MWSSLIEFTVCRVCFSLWRSDWGYWGYFHAYYDGNWYGFGFGKLGCISWGDAY